MKNQVIVVIDPQIDFIDQSGSYAGKHSGIVQILDARTKINKLLKTSCGHSLIVVYSDYSRGQFGEGLSMCIPGTPGHKIDIDIDENIPRFSKTQHSCFSSPEFLFFLRSHNVSHLILCGFLAEYCVSETALDALAQGYSVTLLADCIGTADDVQERKAQMLRELNTKGVTVINAGELEK